MVEDLLPGLWMRDNSFKLKYRLTEHKEGFFYDKGGETVEQVSRRSCTIGNGQDQVGQNFQQHNFIQDVGLDGLQRSLPTQTIG